MRTHRSVERAGRFTRQRLRAEIWADVVAAKWPLLLYTAVVALVAAAEVFVFGRFMPHWAAGFFAGFSTAALLGSVAWVFFAEAGRVPFVQGAGAEMDSAKALEPLTKSGWAVYHDVHFPGRGNIDHVLVGPRIIAVETKWTAAREDRSGYERDRISSAGRQAKDSAKTLRQRLRSVPWNLTVTVDAVVVLWGGSRHRESVEAIDGLTVVSGGSLAAWVPDPTPSLTSDQRARVCEAIERFIADDDDRRGGEELSLIVRHGPGLMVNAVALACLSVVVVLSGIGKLGLSPYLLLAAPPLLVVATRMTESRTEPTSRRIVYLQAARWAWSIAGIGLTLLFVVVVIPQLFD